MLTEISIVVRWTDLAQTSVIFFYQNEDKNLLPKAREGRKGGKRKSSKKGPRKARKAQITDVSDGDDLTLDNSSEASYCKNV